jgi:uncharacterized protein YkwD
VKKRAILFAFLFLSVSAGLSMAETTAAPSGNEFLPAQVAKEINLARSDPEKYAEYLEEFKKNYDGSKLVRPGKKKITTSEGTDVIDDAIRYLRATEPLPPLSLSQGLSLAAADHIRDITGTSLLGHEGSDGSLPGDRLNRRGEWKDAVGENICYGFDTAREIVIWMIIDDGFPSRGHRENIFRPHYHFTGVACAGHPLFSSICVVTFAGDFIEKESGGKAP